MATAAAAAAALAGPSKISPFGTLLRRSKFASFDPAIAQVYTTYDGDAHRGNWGLKRPLPLKRRNAYITVTEVDSREQQTVWEKGEKQARWMQAWQELGVEQLLTKDLDDPRFAHQDHKTWGSKVGHTHNTWVVDSEFGRETKTGDLLEQSKVPILPSISAMTDAQFELFLRKLRKMRPAFRKFMEDKFKEGKVPKRDLLEQAQVRLDYYKEFFIQTMKSKLSEGSSTTLTQEPHPYAGASYSHNTRLSTFFLTPALPGRMLHVKRDNSAQAAQAKDNVVYVTSFGGMTTTLRSSHADGKTEVLALEDGTPRDTRAGATQLRLSKAMLVRAPESVGAQTSEGMRGAFLITEAMAFNKPSMQRQNAHYPGSRAYVAQVEDAVDMGAMFSARTRKKGPRKYGERINSNALLANLRNIVTR